MAATMKMKRFFIWVAGVYFFCALASVIAGNRFASGAYVWPTVDGWLFASIVALEAPVVVVLWAGRGIYKAFLQVPWALLSLLALIVFVLQSERLLPLLKLLPPLKKLKFGSAEVELSEEAKKEVKRTVEETNSSIQEFRKKLNEELAHQVSSEDLEGKLMRLSLAEIASVMPGGKLPKRFRCTLHVEDFLVENRLTQLTGYYPSKEGAGRNWSMRYGIIGKVWRTDNPIVEGNVVAGRPAETAELITKICLEWGLFRHEAEKIKDVPSYFCMPIFHDEKKVGLFFMDSLDVEAFGNLTATDLVAKIKPGLTNKKIDVSLAQIRNAMKTYILQLKVES